MGAVAAYYAWNELGRPWRLTTPLVDFTAQLHRDLPKVVIGTLGDEGHLTANPPLDHTPYASGGYPVTSPHWVVHAADVMHHPENDVDCFELVAYWLAEARAGRMPWLKYLIWRAQIYDVRYGWKPQPNSEHFDHVHLSSRTDFETATLGGWSPIPATAGVDMPLTQDEILAIWTTKLNLGSQGTLSALDVLTQAYRGLRPNSGTTDLTLAAVRSSEIGDMTRDAATLAAIKAITTGGTSIDTAAVTAAISAAAADVKTTFAGLHAEITNLRAQLAAGAAAEAAALQQPPATG